jgi:hypothetical protein
MSPLTSTALQTETTPMPTPARARAVLGVGARGVEGDRARDQRRRRRRLSLEQPAAQRRIDERGRAEDGGDANRCAPAHGQRQREEHPADDVDQRHGALVA